jgi:flagellar M-ring protein FliF
VTLAKPSQTGALAGAAGGSGLPAVVGDAGPEQEGMVTLSMVQGQMRASSINQLQQLVESNPEQSLNVLRRWIAPPEEPA